MPRRKLINNDRAPTLHVTRTPRTGRKRFISVATAFLIQWKFAHPRRVTLQPEMWEYLIGVAEERRAGAGRRPGLVLAGVGQDGLNGPDDEEGRNGGESLKGDQSRGGEELSESELAMFLIQLLVAGNETARNLISAGLVALSTNPDQWAALRADRALVPVAVEELLRWTTPVISFMRTATRPCTLGWQAVAEGDPLLLIYSSANRDEEVFGADADRFRIDRAPNPHVSFGFGPHFCLGAALARLEARVVLGELLDRFATISPAGEVECTASPVIAGERRAPLVFQSKTA